MISDYGVVIHDLDSCPGRNARAGNYSYYKAVIFWLLHSIPLFVNRIRHLYIVDEYLQYQKKSLQPRQTHLAHSCGFYSVFTFIQIISLSKKYKDNQAMCKAVARRQRIVMHRYGDDPANTRLENYQEFLEAVLHRPFFRLPEHLHNVKRRFEDLANEVTADGADEDAVCKRLKEDLFAEQDIYKPIMTQVLNDRHNIA